MNDGLAQWLDGDGSGLSAPLASARVLLIEDDDGALIVEDLLAGSSV